MDRRRDGRDAKDRIRVVRHDGHRITGQRRGGPELREALLLRGRIGVRTTEENTNNRVGRANSRSLRHSKARGQSHRIAVEQVHIIAVRDRVITGRTREHLTTDQVDRLVPVRSGHIGISH